MTNPLLSTWERFKNVPGGHFLVSKILAFKIPYTGTVTPFVLELSPGHSKVKMNDRRAVRNHLNCVHAIAQANLGEFCTGLAMTALISEKGRAIITELSIEYVKKARGTLIAECHCEDVDDKVSKTHPIQSIIRDSSGDIVSKVTAQWLVGPKT